MISILEILSIKLLIASVLRSTKILYSLEFHFQLCWNAKLLSLAVQNFRVSISFYLDRNVSNHAFYFHQLQVPKGLELAIATMPRGEKAVIYVKSQYYTESTLMPVVEGVDEVHFEVELVHFIQVDALFLTSPRVLLLAGHILLYIFLYS